MKEIDDDNATRGNVYTILTIQIHTNKSIKHVNQHVNVTSTTQTTR